MADLLWTAIRSTRVISSLTDLRMRRPTFSFPTTVVQKCHAIEQASAATQIQMKLGQIYIYKNGKYQTMLSKIELYI